MIRAALAAAALSSSLATAAAPLPPMCSEDPIAPDAVRALADVRAEIERLSEIEPRRVVQLLCAYIPRVEEALGTDSAELAWWVASLATPLIAYFDRHDEALPLLDYAEPIFRRTLGPHAAEIADIHVAHAWIGFRRGNLDAAGAAWERALEVREHNPGKGRIELQKVLVGLAQVRLAQRRFDDARRALDRARQILDADGTPVSEAAAAIESAYTALALREEDFVAARSHAERLLAIERAMASPAAQLVAGQAMLGQILERLDEFEAAEAALREAIRLADAEAGAPLQRHRLAALTQLAALLVDRGKAEEAHGFADRAVAEAEATLGRDAPRLVRVLDVRAEVHRALGDLPAALRDYTRAGAIVEKSSDDVERPTQIAHFRGVGALQSGLGDETAARRALRRALAAAGDDATLLVQRAEVLLALGAHPLGQSRQRRRERVTEAIALLKTRMPETHPAILRAVNTLCGLDLDGGTGAAVDCDEAGRRLAAARVIEPGLASLVLLNQSRWRELAGDAEGAYARAVEALSAAESLGAPEPRWRANFALARLLVARGDEALGIFFGKRSIADIERVRDHFVDDDRRFDRTFLADKTAVYRAVADWLVGAGRIDEGLEVLRLLKGEELHDFALREASHGDGGVNDRAPHLARTPVEAALATAYKGIVAGDPVAGAEIETLAARSRDRRISVAEAAALDSLLEGQAGAAAARSARMAAWLVAERAALSRQAATAAVASETIPRERERFGDDAALAVYLVTGSRLRILTATRRGLAVHEAALDAGALRAELAAFLDAMIARGPVVAEQRALYERLMRPVDAAARAAGATRLVLWLDGVLRYVPFAALHDGEAVLADRYSVQVYAEVGAAPPGVAEPRVRGLGVTRAVAGHPALPAIAEELCAIVRGPIVGLPAGIAASGACGGRGQGALPGDAFVDDAFTEDRLRAALTRGHDHDVLHLGTHFALRPGNALRSYLLLGDGSRFTLDRFAELDFGGLRLVTLSACRTGLSGASRGDGREVEGLAALAQRRGAGQVVASLWQVEDASTAALMRALYAALARGADAAGALRDAMTAVRASPRFHHPYYWAGFFVSAGAH